MDLEIKECAIRQKIKAGLIDEPTGLAEIDSHLEVWQTRWAISKNGRWTKGIIPDVRNRYHLPLTMDHFTSQMVTGHGDFRGKLHSFKLVATPGCACGNGSETVQHVLYHCRRTDVFRNELKATMESENEPWPPREGAYLKSKRAYEALRRFASRALRTRTDRQ